MTQMLIYGVSASPFGDLGRSFQISLDASLKSPATIRLYVRGLRALGQFLISQGMPTDPQHVTREHVESFMADIQKRGRSAATVRAYYWGPRQFFAFLIEEGEIKVSPMVHVKAPNVKLDPPQILTDESIRKLLKACEGNDFLDRRDAAIIRVLIDCGLRRAECGGLELDAVDWERRVFTVRGKGGKLRRVPFSRRTALALDRYLRVRKSHRDADSPHLWLGQRGQFGGVGIYQMVQRRAKVAGIGKAWTHLFRHSWTSDALANGVQEGDLMRAGGWSNRAMLDRYGAAAAEERAIENIKKIGRGDRF